MQNRETDLFIRRTVRRAQLLSGTAERRGEGTQANIIVVLFRQLAHRQGVEAEQDLCQELWSGETDEGESERRMKTHAADRGREVNTTYKRRQKKKGESRETKTKWRCGNHTRLSALNK